MSRPLRIEFAGALYHVMARGDARAAIFLDKQPKGTWLIKSVGVHAASVLQMADQICRRGAAEGGLGLIGHVPFLCCALFLEAIGEDRMSEIRAYVQQQRALGSSRFQDPH